MFYKEFNELKVRTLIVAALLMVFLITFVAMRPYTADMMIELSSQLDQMPEFLQKMLGGSAGLTNLADDEYYSLSQWQGKNLGQFLPFVILILVFPIFAREYDKKTIYFLLSRKNRREVFTGKYLTGLIIALALTSVMSLLGPIVMNLSGYSVGFQKSLMILLQELTGVFFFYNIFSLFSIMSRDQVKPVVTGIIVCVGLPLFSMFKVTEVLNPYSYILGNSIINGSGIDWIYTIGLLSISLVLAGINYVLFNKKEF